jgi:hypothetical protein
MGKKKEKVLKNNGFDAGIVVVAVRKKCKRRLTGGGRR